MGQHSHDPDGRQHAGGGAQGERIEGAPTNGGSQAGERSFAPRQPGRTGPEGERRGSMSGRGQEGARPDHGTPPGPDPLDTGTEGFSPDQGVGAQRRRPDPSG